MRKILLLNNRYPSKTNPSHAAFIPHIEECLAAAGFQVDLLVMGSDFRSSTGKYFEFLKFYLRALFFGKYKEYEYVYINMFPYTFLPLIPHLNRMKKVIIHWHGCDIFPESRFAARLNALSYRFVTDSFLHIAPSAYFAKEVARKLNIRLDKIVVSPSGGIDTHLLHNESKKRILNPGTYRIGFASGLLKMKGMELILELLKNIQVIEQKVQANIIFHYIEYGKEREKYADKMAVFANTVKHFSYQPSRMREFYSQIDILLFPSLSESLGLVALEAMSCDVPVVATDDFAFQETVQGGISGERFIKNNLQDLQEALIRCIENIENYRPREFVIKKFSREAVIEKYKEFLNR